MDETLHKCGIVLCHSGHGGRSFLPGVYQICRFYGENHPFGGAYPLLFAGDGLFLLLLLLEKAFAFTTEKTSRPLVLYHVGLNLMVVMLLARGIVQVLGLPLSSAWDASLSGVAGIGHILLGVAMVWLLLQVKASVCAAK